MSTATMSRHATVSARPASTEPGFFSRLWTAIIAAQERKAKTYVRSYLAELPHERLTEMGYAAHEISEIKNEAYPPSARWL